MRDLSMSKLQADLRSWRKPLKVVIGAACTLAMLASVDGLGTVRGVLLDHASANAAVSTDAFLRYADCGKSSGAALALTNPDGARLAHGEVVAGQDYLPKGAQFARDQGLQTAACMMRTPSESLMGNLLAATALETSFIVQPGVPALSADDQALRQRLLDQIKASTDAVYRHDSLARAGEAQQLQARCSKAMSQVHCLPWRVMASAITSDDSLTGRWQAFRHPESIVNRLDMSTMVAARVDEQVALMSTPAALAQLITATREHRWDKAAQQKAALNETALQARTAQDQRIARDVAVNADVALLN